jgi:hypothetical protein
MGHTQLEEVRGRPEDGGSARIDRGNQTGTQSGDLLPSSKERGSNKW